LCGPTDPHKNPLTLVKIQDAPLFEVSRRHEYDYEFEFVVEKCKNVSLPLCNIVVNN